MNVLHLLGQDQDVGGVLSVIRNLQQATACKNWTHVVWVNHTFKETRQPALTYRFSRHICCESANHLLILVQALRAFFELKRLITTESFDVLHAHTRGALLVGLLAIKWLGREVVYTNHGFARRKGLYRWCAAQRGMHTTVLTPNMARHYDLTVQPPKVNIISECCADEFFEEPLVSPAATGTAHRRLRLVGLGNVIRWKNWHLVLEAMCQLDLDQRERIEFSQWGPTPNDPDSIRYEREIRSFIEQYDLGEHAFFRGPTHLIADCLRAADWFVLPSTNEPCSVALIEALALGLPALVSASGGNVDIISNGKTGLFFEPENSADLAARLRSILRGEIILLPPTEIRATVSARSASDVASEYEKVYDCLLHRAPVDFVTHT
jgi:glycosyltransferase involved in cell wall biosynthesis